MAILVATLISQAQLVADKRVDDSISDPDWVSLVNWGVSSLYRLITSLDPEAYFAQADFGLTGTPSGAIKDLNTLAAPAFRALHGVDFNPDTPQRRTVPRRNFRERNGARIGWWVPTIFTDDRAYDLRARNLVVTPYEIAAGTYRIYYRGAPYLFTGPADGTALDTQLEPYDEYVAIMAARHGLGIEDSDQGPGTMRLSELIAEITAEHSRDDGAPAVLGDVEDDGNGRTGW